MKMFDPSAREPGSKATKMITIRIEKGGDTSQARVLARAENGGNPVELSTVVNETVDGKRTGATIYSYRRGSV